MRRYKFSINVKLPGCNEYVRACRGNKYEAAKMKRAVEMVVDNAARGLPRIEGPVRVYFTWREGARRRDLDNVAFAKKFVLDGLVKCGVLPDDNRRHMLGFIDNFLYTPKHWGVDVVIVEDSEE